jgi:TonB family protein
LRYSVEAPLDVTVLRSGIPETVPGRSVNLGAGGLAAVLAGELMPGEAVGVEIRLPEAANSLRTRALVRHNDRLRCGLEFVALSTAQQKTIREFAEKTKARAERGGRSRSSLEAPAPKRSEIAQFGGGPPSGPPGSPKQRSRGWIFFLVSAAVLLGVLLWRWNRGWEELESGLRDDVKVPQVEAHVPADVMEKLVRHRVDPEYPADARPGKLQGVIVLDVIVGSDGTVAEVRALNGPEILGQSAADAMRWWRFEPYRVEGRPVVAETTVAMEFKP